MSLITTVIGALFKDNVIDTIGDLFKQKQEGKITKAELEFKLKTFAEQNLQDINLAQIQVNKEEAKTGSLFIGGWRPFLGWVCGLGFAVNFLIAPFGTWLAALAGYPDVIFPQADLSTMLPVLAGMLGLGGLRTFEKTKGVAKENK